MMQGKERHVLILQYSTWRQGEELPGIEGLLCQLYFTLQQCQPRLRLADWWISDA